ncbi:MAG: hypothetical protein PHQ65_09175 [Bacteroidales bacterium]|nr:hypothetical protein [Bacteroidales bacterium]
MTHKQVIISLMLLTALPGWIKGEGTKQISPDMGNQYFIHIRNSGSRGCFGTKACNDIYTRILFEIKAPGERVYFGAKMRNWYPDTYNYEIKKLDGTLVQSGALPKTAGNPGYIPDYELATLGPSNVTPGGYTAISCSPPDSGTYIFDFDIGNTGSEYELEFFDLTVVNELGEEQLGRLYSYSWNFTTSAGSKKYKGKMYPITADSVVTEIDFNGMQPYAFSVSCNLTGCFNTNNFILDRRSVDGLNNYPQYRVFFNNPDPEIFPSGTLGQLTNIETVNECDGNLDIILWANKPGLCDIMLDIDPTPGFQNMDRYLDGNIEPGIPNVITWDGIDGMGNPVDNGTPITVIVTFVNGRTNLPLYDVEYGDTWQGFKVALVRPPGPAPKVFWCDTLIYSYSPPGNYPPQSLELDGCTNPNGCHAWGGIGDSKTINTWWYSLTSSQFPVPLVYKRSNFIPIPYILCEGDSVNVFGNWVSQPGVFRDTLTNFMGCDSITEITVSVLPGPVIELGEDQVVCQGQSTTLGMVVPGVTAYEWNTIPPQATPLGTDPTLTVNTTATYQVQITAANGCIRTDQVHVTAAPYINTQPIKHN